MTVKDTHFFFQDKKTDFYYDVNELTGRNSLPGEVGERL